MYKLGLLYEKYGQKYTESEFNLLEKYVAQDAIKERESYTRNLVITAIRKFRK